MGGKWYLANCWVSGADKSPGPGGLHTKAMKEVVNEIFDALLLILQNSLDLGNIPFDWKITNVTTSFKKGD